MTNEKEFKKEIVEELTKLHNIIVAKDKEIDMLRTRLIDLGVESSGEEWDA